MCKQMFRLGINLPTNYSLLNQMYIKSYPLYIYIYIYIKNNALNYPQRLICHKIPANKTSFHYFRYFCFITHPWQ